MQTSEKMMKLLMRCLKLFGIKKYVKSMSKVILVKNVWAKTPVFMQRQGIFLKCLNSSAENVLKKVRLWYIISLYMFLCAWRELDLCLI